MAAFICNCWRDKQNSNRIPSIYATTNTTAARTHTKRAAKNVNGKKKKKKKPTLSCRQQPHNERADVGEGLRGEERLSLVGGLVRQRPRDRHRPQVLPSPKRNKQSHINRHIGTITSASKKARAARAARKRSKKEQQEPRLYNFQEQNQRSIKRGAQDWEILGGMGGSVGGADIHKTAEIETKRETHTYVHVCKQRHGYRSSKQQQQQQQLSSTGTRPQTPICSKH